MNKKLGFIVCEFARRNLSFHRDTDWKDIRCFGLFDWGDVAPYLVGNPSHIKTFKKGLVKTNMRKENKTIWCNPTETLWNDYIQPILDKVSHLDYEKQILFIETMQNNECYN